MNGTVSQDIGHGKRAAAIRTDVVEGHRFCITRCVVVCMAESEAALRS